MSGATITGSVLDTAGQPIPNVTVRLVSDLATLGSVPSAVAAGATNFHWTHLINGFSGHRWQAYAKFVAPTTAGMSFIDFKTLVVEYNPALVESAYIFQAERSYLMPTLAAAEPNIAWTRPLTGFQGNRWQCWQKHVAGKVPGLTWATFKTQIVAENPALAADHGRFVASKHYCLPVDLQQRDYACLGKTDRRGQFKFGNLPLGVYQVQVNFPDFLPQSQTITVQHDVALPPFRLIAPPAAIVAEKPNIIAVRPGSISFWLNGAQMRRFVGVNMTLLPHYGKTYREANGNTKKVLEHSELHHQKDGLDKVQGMNAKVVRCFLPHYGVPNEEVATRFEALLALAQERDLYILPALIDLYHNRGAYPDAIQPEDKAVYTEQGGFTRLTTQFFEKLHETLFMPFVEFIVKKFRNHQLRSRIFAWEIGNELKWDNQPEKFGDFMLKIAGQIKALDGTHMVTTGMKSTQHAYMFDKPALAEKLYRSDLIDFITVHSYVDPGATADEVQGIENDANLARRLGKPLLVEEAGVVKTAPDPEQACLQHMAHWLDKQHDGDGRHQSYGYLQWGFDPAPLGDGDSKLWWDTQRAPNIFKHRADGATPI